jgi:hypothetical protein
VREQGRRRVKRLVPLSAIALWSLTVPLPSAGQEGLDPDLTARCVAESPTADELALCADAIAAIQLAQPELGLAAAGGNPVLGTASPIGTKFRFIPRVYFGGRMNFAWGQIPDVIGYPDDPGQPIAVRDFSIFSPQLDLSVGLFDGFKLGSTLGGLASVELLGSLGPLVLPSGEGFRNDVTAAGLGARIGILRESFTAPGLSVSGEYQWTGRIQYGDVAAGSDAQFGIDLNVTSFRAAISKSFVSIALALTLGWDHYQSDVDLTVTDSGGQLVPIIPSSARESLGAERWSAFVDVSYIVLFLNIVAEVGWQESTKLTTSRGDELTAGNLFLSIGIRASL